MKKLFISCIVALASVTVSAAPLKVACVAKAGHINGSPIVVETIPMMLMTIDSDRVLTGNELFKKVSGTARDASSVGLKGGGMVQVYRNHANSDTVVVVVDNQILTPLGVIYTGTNGANVVLQCN